MAWDILSPFYLMDYLKLNLIQFGYIQLFVYGFFIVGINLKRFLIYPMDEIIMKGGILNYNLFYFRFFYSSTLASTLALGDG